MNLAQNRDEWQAYVRAVMVEVSLGTKKDEQYEFLVNILSYKEISCRMSVKVHFLYSLFPWKLDYCL